MASPALSFTDRVGLAAAEDERLRALVGGARTLEDVLRRAPACGLRIHDVVHQDEFTLDVVFAAPGGRFLVFDTT